MSGRAHTIREGSYMILSIIHVAAWYATYSELKTALLPVVFFFRKRNQIQNPGKELFEPHHK